MELANIKRSDKVPKYDSERDGNTLGHLIGLNKLHIPGKSYGGMKPHSKDEHVVNPNAINIFHHKGLEVLNLKTGQPLTQLNMKMTLSSYGDINNDGYIDQVKSSFNDDCTGVVSTVDDMERMLFHGPLCHSPGWIGSVSMTSTVFPDHQVPENTHVAVPPLIVPR